MMSSAAVHGAVAQDAVRILQYKLYCRAVYSLVARSAVLLHQRNKHLQAK